MRILAFGKSVKGNAHEENEDTILINKKLKLFAVADGVTIPKGGKEASKEAIEYLEKIFSKNLKEAFELVNKKIVEEKYKNSGIGYTTLSSVFIFDNNLQVAGVGDSPVLLVRKNRVKPLLRLDIFSGSTLSQAIGEDYIFVNYYEGKLEAKDFIILATDGIADYLNEGEIIFTINKLKTPRKIVNFLIKKVEEKPKNYEDDKSVIVINVK